MKPIDLGVKMQDHLIAEGKADHAMDMGGMGKMDTVKYPEIHYAGKTDLDDLGLEDEGEITVKYKRTFKKSLEIEGVHYYECCLEVCAITGMKDMSPKKPARSMDEAGDALDRIRSEMEESDDHDDNPPGNPGYGA